MDVAHSGKCQDIVLEDMREHARADGGDAHEGSEPLAGNRIESVADLGVISEEPPVGRCLVCCLAILHGYRRKHRCSLSLRRLELSCCHASGVGNGFVELALKERAHEHGHNIADTSGEAGDRDVLEVSAGCLDIRAYPVESCCDVEEREAAGIIPESREAAGFEEVRMVTQRDVDA